MNEFKLKKNGISHCYSLSLSSKCRVCSLRPVESSIEVDYQTISSNKNCIFGRSLLITSKLFAIQNIFLEKLLRINKMHKSLFIDVFSHTSDQSMIKVIVKFIWLDHRYVFYFEFMNLWIYDNPFEKLSILWIWGWWVDYHSKIQWHTSL